MTIGRPGQRFNDIELADLTVSRSHARLEYQRITYVLVPEAANNPTMVNGEVLKEPRGLEDHDQIAMGETVLLFRIDRQRGKRSLRPKEVTLLFSDLRGYSSIAEREPLKPLIDQLHEYLREMSQIVKINGGTLLSYQGDALMAVFGAPTRHVDDADRSVNSALQMLHKLRQLNHRWQGEGRPEFRCGIGINSGQAMVGDIGIDEHIEYAAMGDDTNITARIEELTRHYEADLIISEKTMEKLVGRYQSVCLGQVQIRGREQPITIYGIKGYQAADITPKDGVPSQALPTAPPQAESPLHVLGVHDTRSQPEIGLKLTLDVDKIEAPREQPVGVWRGTLKAESMVNGALIQYEAEAEMTVEPSLSLRFACTGHATAKGQSPMPWGLSGTGYYTPSQQQLSTVFLTFSHGSHISTWSFPAKVQDRGPTKP
jgi:class 3 adenylate cyclase